MAEGKTHWFKDKSSHILGQLWMGMKKGAQIGAVGGAIIGVVSLLAGSAAVTIPALIGYTLLGGLGGSFFGMQTGGFIGGIKGLLGRPKPNGDQLMTDAQACAQEQGPPQPDAPAQGKGQEPGAEKGKADPDAPAPVAGGVSVTNTKAAAPAAAPANAAPTIPPAALAELKAATQSLEQQTAPAASAQAPAQPVAQSWQGRVQAQQEQAAMADRQR